MEDYDYGQNRYDSRIHGKYAESRKYITEEMQKKIYVITAKLGVIPFRVITYCDSDVQVNWRVDGKSYMELLQLDSLNINLCFMKDKKIVWHKDFKKNDPFLKN